MNKKRSEEVSVKENNVKNDKSIRCIKHHLKANVRQYLFPTVLYNFCLLRLSPLSVDSKLLPPLRKKK